MLRIRSINSFSSTSFFRGLLIFLTFLYFLNPTTGHSQQKQNSDNTFTPIEIWEGGTPYIENFSTSDYKHSPWNFGIIEGNNGFIYIGNGEGVLEFDGNNWDFIPTEQKSWIMTFSKTEDEKIFLGGNGNEQLGYLAPNELGTMTFNSLVSFLEPKYKDFGSIVSTVTIGNIIYFSSEKYLFRWDGEKFKTWETEGEFRKIFNVNNTLYISDLKFGLQKLVDDTLHFIPGSETLISHDKNFSETTRDIFPYQYNQILIVHPYKGLLRYNGKSFYPLNKESNEKLKESIIHSATILSSGDYALGTLANGLCILDGKTGEIKKEIKKKQGLASNEIYAVYEDNNGTIWTCGGKGISKIEWSSPFRMLNESHGLHEIANKICYQSGKLFVDNNGLYQLEKNPKNKELLFKKIKGIRPGRLIGEGILSSEHTTIAFNESQIYKIDDTYNAQLIEEKDWRLVSSHKSTKYADKFYIGTWEKELYDISLINNRWVTKRILKIDGAISYIQEDSKGNLWLSVYNKGLYFVKKSSDASNEKKEIIIKKYDTLSGLPSNSGNFYMTFLQNNPVVYTTDGYYRFNQNAETFEKRSLWGIQKSGPDENSGRTFFGLKDDNIWHLDDTNELNKLYRFSKNKLSEIKDYKLLSDSKIDYLELMDEIALFATPNNGILMYNQDKSRDLNRTFSTKLRKVWSTNDSLIYAGSKQYKNEAERFKIPFKNNRLKFEYTLPSYTKSKQNRYQYFLEGFDKDWSSWSTDTKRNYTNLPEGNYTFKVRSKNIYDEIGNEDLYYFTISPPWHRTWWAYLLYIATALTFIVLLIKWRSQNLKRKNDTLEQLITERTTEIRQKNELLSHQTEQLELLNESKTRLYSNITHEFRTPLTVILGMTETLKKTLSNNYFNEADTSLDMIRRNGKNLLQLVNEMLDLAKVESGTMQLNLVQTDIVPYLKYLNESFHSLAASKKINLTVYSEIDSLEMDVDITKMTAITSNLLSNAIKFTKENGKIIVHLTTLENGNVFSLKVKDNGIGLSEENITNLFNRFYQAHNTPTKPQEGTGIGLALVKEFVALMKGTVTVESTLGTGSTFIVKLPVTTNAIKTVASSITETSVNTETPIIIPEPATNQLVSELPLVLLIEDNSDVAQYLQTCLKENYQTIHAIDGNKGIKMAYEHIPDIIISDVMMPNKDGFEVCKTLKTDERTNHIPIILLTAKVTTKDRLTGLTYGADAYLAKPFNQNELFARLDQLILVRKKLIAKLQKNGISSLLKEKVESPQTKFLKQVIECIHRHLEDTNFGPVQLAKEIGFSESQVYRKLKSITDKSTAIYIRAIRLQKAKELIETTDLTISEIAYQVGFNDPSWFSRAFKQEFNLAPSEINR